ncbi:hypothetical protein OJF2_40770 [Aquisphaera giovannonii]|uniref:Uncharacterized protein n=1 Tax=Aquisphaera giovannonii TaxID=406548 RepID=A0A5B9W5X6_9BACT|nr:hypothetical protein [Aquisphaera giovannonii]QEH35525.1 hypothetical protein OJF2_40770 [Aquisphaera giovannonii]
MSRGSQALDLANRVRTPAIERYAEGLGWTRVPAIGGSIAVYERPDSPLHQLIVPLDESYDDYGETVLEAARKLAAFEGKPLAEVLALLVKPSEGRRKPATRVVPAVPSP